MPVTLRPFTTEPDNTRKHRDMSTTSEGSRKHLLVLIDPTNSTCTQTMNTLLRGHAQVGDTDTHAPTGGTQVSESEIPDFCKKHCPDLFDRAQLDGWWLPDQSSRPKGATWDLLSTCSVGDRPGLLLVEAKAHEKELGLEGKSLDPAASAQTSPAFSMSSGCLIKASASVWTAKAVPWIIVSWSDCGEASSMKRYI